MGIPISRHSGLQSRVNEDIVLVWLDPNISKSDVNIQEASKQLRLQINTVKIFTDIDECLDYFAHVKNEIIFMIISGGVGEQLIPQIENMTQIDSIYVFCINKSKHQVWTKHHRKVKAVHTQIGHICHALKRDLETRERILAPVHIIASNSMDNLNELDQSFMYSHLLKEILLELEYDKKAKKDFINFCRIQYTNNNPMLKVIDEFEEKYDQPSPIWWYTQYCFIYSVLNKALRTQDLEIIIMMGFIVRDLHLQIEKSHSKSRNEKLITVYRGQGMSHVEFNKLKENQGGIISFHNFLSTSIDREVSLSFAESVLHDPDLIGILFIMKIDPSISTAPFVFLDNISHISNQERECLFSMNTIFRIGEITNLSDQLWEVNLTLSDNNDKQLKRLIQHLQQENEGKTALQRLGHLLFKMDELDKAEKMFHKLLNMNSNNDWEQSLYAHLQLGYIYNSRSNLPEALVHYKQSAEIASAHRPSTNGLLFKSYSNIGVILHKQGDLDAATQYFQLAIDVEECAVKPNDLAIATRFDNIGRIYQQQGNFTEAMKNYNRVVKIHRSHAEPRHPSLLDTYKNMATIYYSSKNYAEAFYLYEKILEIQQKSSPTNNTSLAETHHWIATILEHLNRYTDAIEHLSKAITLIRQAPGPDRAHIQIYEQYHDYLLQKL